MTKWQFSRAQYGFSLGILIAIWIHFPQPKALFVFAIASGLTAFRFQALGWRPSRALIPVAIAGAGSLLAMLLGPHSRASTDIAHIWRGAAVVAQLGMTIRAVLNRSAIDPISPKQALALNFLDQRRRTKRAIKEFQPQIEAHRSALETLNALRSELADHIAAHGDKPSAERTRLLERLAEQNFLMRASTEDLQVATAKIRSESDALRAATQAWKNRDNRAA